MDAPLFKDTVPKLSVSELTSLIKTTLEESFYGLTVEGEISGFRPASTGHWYFSLKDQNAVIGCCMWRSTIPRVNFKPRDGMKVIVTGSISVFEPRGSYQIICTSMKVAGEGDILAMLEERKRKYDALGYFDPAKKKPIPRHPGRVAIITSPTGAALQDILQITGRRNMGMDLIILPAVVQGDGAAPTIAERIREVNEFLLADVMIVGRGGGSIEDLLPFSEECVIEAIHESDIPVISAVGHEIDWALSDFVADLRAPTPSAAAELVCESSLDQINRVAQLKSAMYDAIIGRLNSVRLRIAAFSPASARAQLDSRLNRVRMRLDADTSDMRHRMDMRVSTMKSRSELLRHKLDALSPLAVLDRGYAIVAAQDGSTVKSVKQVNAGEALTVTMKDGKMITTIREVENG